MCPVCQVARAGDRSADRHDQDDFADPLTGGQPDPAGGQAAGRAIAEILVTDRRAAATTSIGSSAAFSKNQIPFPEGPVRRCAGSLARRG